jgi:hypothetical protein
MKMLPAASDMTTQPQHNTEDYAISTNKLTSEGKKRKRAFSGTARSKMFLVHSHSH